MAGYVYQGSKPDPKFKEAQEAADLLTAVLVRLLGITRRNAAMAAPGRFTTRTTCDACGCLVLPDEHCPGCAVRWERRAA